MKPRLCAADDCLKPFEPAFGQDHQKYCSPRCASRMRVRHCRARKRYGDDGGGPGGKRRQARLFPASAVNRRTKPKPEIRLKQDDLFPEDGAGLFATLGGGVEYAKDESGNEQVTCYRTRKPSVSTPNPILNQSQQEASLAA